MNHYENFMNLGVTQEPPNIMNTHFALFDMDENCELSVSGVVDWIEEQNIDTDTKSNISLFLLNCTELYKEVGVNLGALFFNLRLRKEYKLNLEQSHTLDIKKVYNINSYIEKLFSMMCQQHKDEIHEKFHELDNKINILKRNAEMDSCLPGELVDMLMGSNELKYLSYYFVRASFKTGLLLCLAYHTINIQLEGEVGFKPPPDWPCHML